MKLSTLLALRFIKNNAQEKNISFMIKICFISIALSSCALTLVSAIMQGFEIATYKKLQGINADIILRSHRPLNVEKITTILTDEFADTIEACSPVAIGQVVIQSGDGAAQLSNAIALLAVDPAKYAALGNFDTMLIAGITSIAELTDKTIIIGQTLAQNLHAKVGDAITLLYPETITIEKNKITLGSRSVIIAGIFKTGIEEFDEQTIYSSLELYEDLFETGVTQFAITVKNKVDSFALKEKLIKRLGINAYTWQELYPPLLAALRLEKYVAFLVLSLMALLACMTIIAVLFMLITQKKVDIAILKSMGMRTKDLISTFIKLGTLMSFIASGTGIFFAYSIGILLTWFPLPLPEAYYITELPILFDVPLVLTILALTTIMGLLASWYAAARIRHMSVSSVFKHEN